jgi:hypothetical protein
MATWGHAEGTVVRGRSRRLLGAASRFRSAQPIMTKMATTTFIPIVSGRTALAPPAAIAAKRPKGTSLEGEGKRARSPPI